MSLHARNGGRKYLNAVERRRFVKTVQGAPAIIRMFCVVLMWSGGRISEVLALTPAAVDLDDCLATFQTLKRRRPGIMRQVPLPNSVVRELDMVLGVRAKQHDPMLAGQPLWPWSRATAWRYVKAVMKSAGIGGAAAMPKGLRHTFGVAAFENLVPPHIVQRWLGHASLRTTAIYADVSGREERAFAARIWDGW